MIAKLTGIVDAIAADHAIIDVGGVGYLVHCSSRTLGRLGPLRAPASLAVETTLREDAILLYGFAETEERDWFRLLQTVQGVGGRVALAVLSALSPDRLAAAIVTEDRTALTQADGVGPKLAGRIIAELKDKAGRVAVAAMPAALPGEVGGALSDAVSALVNLGYARSEAHTAVARAARLLGAGAAVTALVPAALRELSQ